MPFQGIRVQLGLQIDLGHVLFPPAVPFLMPIHCGGAPSTRVLPPGATWQQRQLVIVRGHYIRASATFSPSGTAGSGTSYFTVRTRPTWVRLVPRDNPPVWLCAFSHLCANVEPPLAPVGLHVHGPLYYAFATKCAALIFVQKTFLSPAPVNPPVHPPRYRIYPGCPNPAVWDFVVGWLGTPMTHIHYTSR